MDDPQEVRELLVKHGLAEKADALMALVRPSIRIFTQPADDADLPVGVSKIGGEPDLPPGFEWPMWEHEPLGWYAQHMEKIRSLGFLAQFNLAELASYDVEYLLPPIGMLYFFYDGVEQPWDDTLRGGARVYYVESMDIVRTTAPENLPKESRFKTCRVTFKTELTLPSAWSGVVHLSREEFKRHMAVEDILYKETKDTWPPVHRLLGHPQPIQGEVAPQGHLLLFQLDSDYDADMVWGDVGKLYFWLREEALAARRFDDGALELQCT
jgi:uncharacterized protein YwqG